MENLLGIDIGGTKSAVCVGTASGELLGRCELATRGTAMEMLEALAVAGQDLLKCHGKVAAAGIVCGGPLDLESGCILSPPNLPGWDQVPVVEFFSSKFGLPVGLQNDANAGAMAEWRFGAGIGSSNLMFCTMGTGFGCGLILGGRLYAGTNGNAGELGHVRLTPGGPHGYGKAGSVEGWCSGGGIAQLARIRLAKLAKLGGEMNPSRLLGKATLTARDVAEAAANGDELALAVFAEVGNKLGTVLAMAVDFLNLDTIVLGSIFSRQECLIRPAMEEVLERECLPASLAACRIHASGLGERIGDVAALTVAMAQCEDIL